jgi:hypothetical protein
MENAAPGQARPDAIARAVAKKIGQSFNKPCILMVCAQLLWYIASGWFLCWAPGGLTVSADGMYIQVNNQAMRPPFTQCLEAWVPSGNDWAAQGYVLYGHDAS